MSDVHINNIIETYRKRNEIEKYSKRERIEEITNNDFNLNIPGYVDTFEAEEDIDINAIAIELKNLEVQMKETDSSITEFCKELNIKTPF